MILEIMTTTNLAKHETETSPDEHYRYSNMSCSLNSQLQLGYRSDKTGAEADRPLADVVHPEIGNAGLPNAQTERPCTSMTLSACRFRLRNLYVGASGHTSRRNHCYNSSSNWACSRTAIASLCSEMRWKLKRQWYGPRPDIRQRASKLLPDWTHRAIKVFCSTIRLMCSTPIVSDNFRRWVVKMHIKLAVLRRTTQQLEEHSKLRQAPQHNADVRSMRKLISPSS